MYHKFGRYRIYRNGEVYSEIRNKFLKPDNPGGYHQYGLWIDGEYRRYKAHQLVAKFYLGEDPYGVGHINHIDGNKTNNCPENLEWTTPYLNNLHARETGLNPVSKSNSERWEDPEFRERTSKAISKGMIGATAHTKNPRYRYEIKYRGEILSRKELKSLLGLAQSTTDRIIREGANGKIHPMLQEKEVTIVDLKKVNRLSKRSTTAERGI